MNVLALDTTSRAGSAALVTDGRLVVVRRGDAAQPHGGRLPGELMRVLAEAGVPLRAVDLFAVAAGPGSFTGLRVGIASIQGLAFATGRCVAALSALDALAQAATAPHRVPPGGMVGAWVDAYRGEVYHALYRVEDAANFSPARLTEVDEASVGRPDDVLARWQGLGATPAVLTGDGAVAYADLVAASQPGIVLLPPPMIAGAIGLMAVARAAIAPMGLAADVRPLYIRRPDAEVTREAARAERQRLLAASGGDA